MSVFAIIVYFHKLQLKSLFTVHCLLHTLKYKEVNVLSPCTFFISAFYGFASSRVRYNLHEQHQKRDHSLFLLLLRDTMLLIVCYLIVHHV